MQLSKKSQYNMISFAIILNILSVIAFAIGMFNFKSYETVMNVPMASSLAAFLFNFTIYICFNKTNNKCCNMEFPASLVVLSFIILISHFLIGSILAIAHL